MKWIPVEERMPEMDSRVLTLAPECYYPVAIHILRHMPQMNIDWWMGDNNFIVTEGRITHWMPLPPEEDE